MGTTKKSRTQLAKELIGPEMVELFQSKDPSSSNKYLSWMAKQFDMGHDQDEIIRITDAFHRRNAKLKHQDIYQYEDLRDIDLELAKLPASKKERKELASLREGIDYITLIDKHKIRFYLVLTYKGMKSLGYGTSWCIQAQEHHWKNYKRNNNIFVFFNDRLDKKDPKHKIAILHSKSSYDHNITTGWDQKDRSFQWRRDIGNDIGIDLINKMNLVNKVLGHAINTDVSINNNIATYDGIKSLLHYADELSVQDIKDSGLLSLMPYSTNLSLLRKLKTALIKRMGRADGSMPFSTEFSSSYRALFKEYIDSTVLDAFKHENIIKNVSCPLLREFKKILKKLPDDEIKQLLNETEYATTRKMLIELRPNLWRSIKPEHVSAGIAFWLVKKFGSAAVVKGYKYFGKEPRSSGYWNHRKNKENPYTRKVRSMKLPDNVIRALRKKKDLPVKFSKYLDKIEKKELTQAERKTLKKAMEIVAKASKKKKNDLTYRDFNFHYKKALLYKDA